MARNMTESRAATAQAEERPLVALIERIAQGDEAAYAALYDATSSMVYGLALRIVRQADVAEDVTLDVYMQVYRQAASYDAQRGTPSAWLLMLTRSRALDQQRRARVRQQREVPLELSLQVPAATSDPETHSLAIDLRRSVQHALALLSPEQRQVIETAYYTGLSHAEIAAQLGQPLGTVKTRIRTGMQVLRTLLAALLDDVAPSETAVPVTPMALSLRTK